LYGSSLNSPLNPFSQEYPSRWVLDVQFSKASELGPLRSNSSPPQASYTLALPSILVKNIGLVSSISEFHSKATSNFPFL